MLEDIDDYLNWKRGTDGVLLVAFVFPTTAIIPEDAPEYSLLPTFHDEVIQRAPHSTGGMLFNRITGLSGPHCEQFSTVAQVGTGFHPSLIRQMAVQPMLLSRATTWVRPFSHIFVQLLTKV
jgi:hypothetical protein